VLACAGHVAAKAEVCSPAKIGPADTMGAAKDTVCVISAGHAASASQANNAFPACMLIGSWSMPAV
jgi:hypothetical protein